MRKSFQYLALAGAALISFCLWPHPSNIVSALRAESAATKANGDVGSLYKRKCAECHGKDGRSKSVKGKLSHARDLTDAEWQQRVSDERIYNSISNGKGKMPGFSKKLSETEINSLAKYVRDLKK